MPREEIFRVDNGSYSICKWNDGVEFFEFHESSFGRLEFEKIQFIISIDGVPEEKVERAGALPDNENKCDRFILQTTSIAIIGQTGFHKAHGVPLKRFLIRNVSGHAIRNVRVELWHQLADGSPYAVYSSSDSFTFSAKEPGKGNVSMIMNTPDEMTIQVGEGSHVNSLILNKTELDIEKGEEYNEALVPDDRIGKMLKGNKNVVVGDPSYKILCPYMEADSYCSLAVSFWFQKSLTDTPAFSGISFLVPINNRGLAFSCLTVPTHLGYGVNPVYDNFFGIANPIDFYDSFTFDNLCEGCLRVSQHTKTNMLYILADEDYEDEELNTLLDTLKKAIPQLTIMIVPWMGSINETSMKLRLSMNKTLDTIGGNTSLTVIKTLYIAEDTTSDDSLYAALTPSSMVFVDPKPEELYRFFETFKTRQVVLLGPFASKFANLIGDIINYFKADTEILNPDGKSNFAVRYAIDTPLVVAAERCISNIVVGSLIINDYQRLNELSRLIALNFKMQGEEINMRNGFMDISDIRGIARAVPQLIVSSFSYTSAGPPTAVVSIFEEGRWQDSFLAAQYARAKKCPVMFVRLHRDKVQKLEDNLEAAKDYCINSFEESVESLRNTLVKLGYDWITPAQKEVMRKISRNSLTLFTSSPHVPWELSVWSDEPDNFILLSTKFNLSRISVSSIRDTAVAMYTSIKEMKSPLKNKFNILFFWDRDVDQLMGDVLLKSTATALDLNYDVHLLTPQVRSLQVAERFVGHKNLRSVGLSSRENLIRTLSENEFDIVHISAHGDDLDGSEANYMILNNEKFTTSDVPQLRGRPIIILSSCFGGSVRNSHDAPTGLAFEFIEKGAFQFIAPVFPVRNTTAQFVAESIIRMGLYKSPSQALRQCKLLIFEQLKRHQVRYFDVLWYVAYGEGSRTKFYELDGISEIENAIEKLTRRRPTLLARTPGKDVQKINNEAIELFSDIFAAQLKVIGKWIKSVKIQKDKWERTGSEVSFEELDRLLKRYEQHLNETAPKEIEAMWAEIEKLKNNQLE